MLNVFLKSINHHGGGSGQSAARSGGGKGSTKRSNSANGSSDGSGSSNGSNGCAAPLAVRS